MESSSQKFTLAQTKQALKAVSLPNRCWERPDFSKKDPKKKVSEVCFQTWSPPLQGADNGYI